MSSLEDADDDKFDKQKKRVRRKKAKTRSGPPIQIPTSIVCDPIEAASQPGAVELGLLLSFVVFMIYFFGCYETYMNLPDVPRSPSSVDHLGMNFNVARNKFEEGGIDTKSLESPAKAGEQKVVAQPKVTSSVEIPPSKWPVTLRDEQDDYEDLIHAGDMKTVMKVPKFWSKPIHQNGLMSRETAMKIGSCIEPDEYGNHARGDKCPVDKRTIFINIASYRDFECRTTLESAFLRAKHPERIRVAVVDQIVHGEDPLCDEPIEPCDKNPEQALCKYKNQIDVYEMAAELSIGPVFARHIGYRMYRGEYYATQSDAHVSFTTSWDTDIIAQIEQTHNEMAVLSTYLTDVQGSIDQNGNSKRKTRPIMCNTKWEGGVQGMHLRHGSQPEKLPSIHGEPQLSPWWAAGYSFSRGHFVVNVPYDWLSPMIFQGEEMSIGIRGFTIGYDFYAPERSVCFHHYAVGKNAKLRNKVHHFWENGDTYKGTGIRAMARLLGIVHMNPEVDPSSWDHTDEAIYGVGGVRTPEKFYQMYGIDVVKKTAEGNLCNFVDSDGSMHKMFVKHLRPDGMGIDYTNVDFRWVDPAKGRGGRRVDDQAHMKGDDGEEEEEEEGDDGNA